MGSPRSFTDRLRRRIRDERERRGWSRARLATAVEGKGVTCYPSTVAKIEDGDRSVRVEELAAMADIFGMSIDALVGRSRGSELVQAVSGLTSNAQKMAGEVEHLRSRLRGEYDDVREAISVGGAAVTSLLEIAESCLSALGGAQSLLNRLANQFPIPT